MRDELIVNKWQHPACAHFTNEKRATPNRDRALSRRSAVAHSPRVPHSALQLLLLQEMKVLYLA